MKILYIAHEHHSGTLDIFIKGHEKRGNEARLVTMFNNVNKFYEDIQIDLPWVPKSTIAKKLKHFLYTFVRGKGGVYRYAQGYPPLMHDLSIFEKVFFSIRDKIWYPRIEKAIKDYNLYDVDVYHFENGVDFFRDARFAKKLKSMGKTIICSYHGSDMRLRGVQKELDAITDANVTCELDLLECHPSMKYIFLPFEYSNYPLIDKATEAVRICHTTRSRYCKGSDDIIEIASRAAEDRGAVFDLIENVSHEEVIRRKKLAHIAIDQISDTGGWGYGINSLETMSMGIATCSCMNKQYEKFLPDHPFVNVNKDTLYDKLITLIDDSELRKKKGLEGRAFVEKYHDPNKVLDSIYSLYSNLGVIQQ